MSASTVQEGTLSGGHPYLRLGDGDPLVVLRGFTPTHTNPRQGFQRSTELRILRPLAEHFTVYAVNRRPGLPEGTITAPTLVICGDRDLCYSTEMLRQTARGIPDARLLLYPRCGHGGTFIRRRFGSDVTGFLSS